MRLEERIVLDAAGAADAAEHDYAADEIMPHAEALPGNTAEHAAVTETGSGGGDRHGDGIRAIMISSAIQGADALMNSLRDDVVAVKYDGINTTPDTLLDLLEAALHGKQADSIALATHGLDDGGFQLTANQLINLETLHEPEMHDFWLGMSTLIAENGRMDILACNAASGNQGAELVEAIEQMSGIDLAASDDPTGNPASGGDWLLETDNINAADIYFAANSLSGFDGFLLNSAPENITLNDPTPVDMQTTETSLTGGGAAGDGFGSAVDVDGDRIIIGEPLGGVGDGGLAYVYTWSGTAWVQEGAVLDDASGRQGDAVSIDADWALVGAPANNGNQGQVAFYHWGGANWTSSLNVNDPDTTNGDRFGAAVAIDGKWGVAGAPDDNDAAISDSGKIYIYEYNGVLWLPQNNLLSPDGTANSDHFGCAVAVQSDAWIFAGASGEDDFGADAGAAYAFQWDGAQWNNIAAQTLSASDAGAGDAFGTSLAFDGNRVVVGAPGNGAGAAYIFEMNAGNWTEVQKLTPSNGAGGDMFGSSVSIDGDTIIVGADRADTDGQIDAGAAYIFRFNGTAWVQTDMVTATGAQANDHFGAAVGAGPGMALVGAPERDTGAGDAGAAYSFHAEPQVNENSAAGTVVGTLSATDPDGDPVTFSIVGGETGNFALSGNQVVIRTGASLDFESQPEHSITVRADDGMGNTRDEVMRIHLADLAEAPTVTNAIPDQTAVTEQDFDYTLPAGTFVDQDSGDTFTLSARLANGAPLPAWLTFNPATGRFSGTPDSIDAGNLTIEVIATDTSALTGSDTFELVIDAASAIVHPPASGGTGTGSSGNSGSGTGETGETGSQTENEIVSDGTAFAPLHGEAELDSDALQNMDFGAMAHRQEREHLPNELAEDATRELVNIDLSLAATDLAFDDNLLADRSQPVEIREAFDAILHAYTGSSEELQAYLQSAFRSVAESTVAYRYAQRTTDQVMTRLSGIADEIPVIRSRIITLAADIEQARSEMRSSVTDLRLAIETAAREGEQGFDLAYENIIDAAILGLGKANQDLITESRVATLLYRKLRGQNFNLMADAEHTTIFDKLLASSRTMAQEQARLECRQRDQASVDIFAAFIKRLVQTRQDGNRK